MYFCRMSEMLKRVLESILFILVSISSISSQTTFEIEGTLPYPRESYKEINNNINDGLQYALNEIVFSNKTWKKLVNQKRMAVGLVDLRDMHNAKFAAINGEHMMYAASLPKIAVLLTAMVAIKEDCLNYDAALKKDLRLMIAKSNNAATTRVIERLGFDKIESVMTDSNFNLYDISEG